MKSALRFCGLMLFLVWLPDVSGQFLPPTVVRVEIKHVGPATVSELAAPFDMKLPSFVQHLSVLEQSRLVKSKKRGRIRTYELAPERFKVVEDWLSERRRLWEARLDQFDQYVTQLKKKASES